MFPPPPTILLITPIPLVMPLAWKLQPLMFVHHGYDQY